jgi:hypothetical protein
MIELTLNYNHMLSVVAQTGAIGTPAQLLPFIIGAISFLRILYLIYKESKEAAEKAAEESDLPPLTFMQTVRKLISPSARWGPPATTDHDDSYMVHPWHRRYIVSWLPWLTVSKFWRRQAVTSVGSSPTVTRPVEKDGFEAHVSGRE